MIENQGMLKATQHSKDTSVRKSKQIKIESLTDSKNKTTTTYYVIYETSKSLFLSSNNSNPFLLAYLGMMPRESVEKAATEFSLPIV